MSKARQKTTEELYFRAANVVAIIVVANYWRTPAPRCPGEFDGYSIIMEARVGPIYSEVYCLGPNEVRAKIVTSEP